MKPARRERRRAVAPAELATAIRDASGRIGAEHTDPTRRPELVGSLVDLARGAERGGLVSTAAEVAEARRALELRHDAAGCLAHLAAAVAIVEGEAAARGPQGVVR